MSCSIRGSWLSFCYFLISPFWVRYCLWCKLLLWNTLWSWNCDRMKRWLRVLLIISLRLMDRITTKHNFCLHYVTWWQQECTRRRHSLAGRLYFWPITSQYKNVFTPRLTRLLADKDCRPLTTVQGQTAKIADSSSSSNRRFILSLRHHGMSFRTACTSPNRPTTYGVLLNLFIYLLTYLLT